MLKISIPESMKDTYNKHKPRKKEYRIQRLEGKTEKGVGAKGEEQKKCAKRRSERKCPVSRTRVSGFRKVILVAGQIFK